MRPRMVRSPVDICLGTRPSQAEKSRPLANAAPLPIAATMALEMIGPMPGTVITLRQLSSAFASVSISSVTVSISIIELPPVAGKITDDAYHAWRKRVRSLGQNVGQQLAKEPRSLPNDYAALQEKAANLIDHGGPLADKARAYPVKRLQIELLIAF